MNILPLGAYRSVIVRTGLSGPDTLIQATFAVDIPFLTEPIIRNGQIFGTRHTAPLDAGNSSTQNWADRSKWTIAYPGYFGVCRSIDIFMDIDGTYILIME